MDARSFGAFLARTRRERGLTQSALAEQLHVTDKAVSRWERGLGFPDIGTLEPLAQALGLTLEELMQAGRSPDAPAGQARSAHSPLELPPAIEWRSVRAALFLAAAALAVAALFLLPAQVVTQWHPEDGVLYPGAVLPTPLVYLCCLGFTFLFLRLWETLEQGRFYRSVLTWLQILHPRLALGFQLLNCLWASAPLLCETVIFLFNR